MAQSAISSRQVYEWLSEVRDPEVPVLTIGDLGIIRDVELGTDPSREREVTVTITPTYSGCPAMDVIAVGIRMALASRGFTKVHIKNRLHPAWTTDWMSEEGKQKLLEYGIAPPLQRGSGEPGLFEEAHVPCPRCGSEASELVSRFGATSCKSLYRCMDCLEPFEHFKCH